MNPIIARAIVALVLAGTLCFFTAGAFLRTRATGSLLELIGAAALAMLGLTHLCEGLDLLPWMRWGTVSGPGHFLNLASVAIALTFLPLGYVLTNRQTPDHDVRGH
jgi:hypothetical protein